MDLLFEHFHDRILNSVAELGVHDSVLEELFCVREVLAISVILGAKDHHQTEGKMSKRSRLTQSKTSTRQH